MNREILQQALDALKNGINVRQSMGSTKLQISFENEAIAALERELAKTDKPLRLSPVYEYGHIHEASQPEHNHFSDAMSVFEALRQALAQPEHPLDKKADNARELGLDYEPDVPLTDEGKTEQEPFAWVNEHNTVIIRDTSPEDLAYKWKPLYAAPPMREWVGLTDDEIKDILNCGRNGLIDIKKVEAKLREKNGY